MEIKTMEVENLVPYDNNPRNNDDAVQFVANSIKEFGFKVPIVIDKNHVIVAGHTRYKAALSLGLKSVPCIIADDLSQEQVRAFRLADNKVSEVSEWNEDLLSDELEALTFDMEKFGFELDDIIEIAIDDEEIGDGVSFDHTMKIDNTTIILTEDEYLSIIKKLDDYVDVNGVSFGFVGELLCNL